jgi:diacylglycerol kinase family enzyme
MKRVKVMVIVNAAAGAGARAGTEAQLAQAFEAAGAEARIWFAGDGPELAALAERAAHGDAEHVVAGGGDGTINAVATAIIDSGKTLGVLPLGTMNHFAKDLGIPLDLDAAVGTVVAGHATRVDVGDVNGRVFLNNSSLGLYPRVIQARRRQQRLGWHKWPAYLWAAIGVLRRYPFLDVRLSVGGTEVGGRTPFVFVGNNAYDMERFTVGSRACLDGGTLSLYTTSHAGRLGLISLALRALLGGLRQDRDFLACSATDVWVGTRRTRLRVALDGEVTIMEPPLHYRIRPGALRVLVPVPATGRRGPA